MLHHGDDKRAKGQRGRIVATMGDGRTGMADGGGTVLVTEPGMHVEDLVAPGQEAVGASVIGLERQGPFEDRSESRAREVYI